MPSTTRPTPAAAARRAGILLSALALAACADAGIEPRGAATDAVIAADLAAAEGGAIALELADFAAPGFSVAGGPGAAAPLLAPPPGCTFSAATGSYTCATSTNGSTTVSRTITYFDAAGATMADYDAALTASVRHAVQMDGTRGGSGPNGTFSATVHRQRTRTVSGLAGTETRHTWNGVGSASDTATHTGAGNTRVYSKSVRDTATNVVVNLPRSANPYPASGQVVHAVNAKVVVSGARSDTRTVDRRVVVTFNGTAAVPITVGGVSCTLHLDTRTVDGCSR